MVTFLFIPSKARCSSTSNNQTRVIQLTVLGHLLYTSTMRSPGSAKKTTLPLRDSTKVWRRARGVKGWWLQYKCYHEDIHQPLWMPRKGMSNETRMSNKLNWEEGDPQGRETSTQSGCIRRILLGGLRMGGHGSHICVISWTTPVGSWEPQEVDET